MTTLDFIYENLDKTVRCAPEGDETMLYTPYPYITPCIEGMFQEMYYWDTYFTNKAFLSFNKTEQVVNTLRDFYCFLQNHGRIPNGNRTYYLNRSQPPFFGLMIADVLQKGTSLLSVDEAFTMLEREYKFWTEERMTPTGLNKYSCDLTDEQCIAHFGKVGESGYEQRVGVILERTAEKCRSVLAECESGWDFTPRFHGDCLHFNPVDLNCLLYADELLLSKWGEKSGRGEYYAQRAAARKAAMDKYMLAQDGIYYDYDFVEGKRSENISCANFFPFFVGLSTNEAAFIKILSALEREHGIVAGLTDKRAYQWAEPNGWAPLTYISVMSAAKLGRKEDAVRLAKKYVTAIDGIFKSSGRLWEKYNAETGTLDVVAEYDQPEMLGWTAGVYVALSDFLKENA